MAGAEPVLDLLVVALARIHVVHEEPDRGARRAALEHAREDPDAVRFLALARELRLASAPRFQIGLDVRLRKLEPGRTAVHDRADRRPVAFTEGRHAERAPDRVSRHCLDTPSPAGPRRAAGKPPRTRARTRATQAAGRENDRSEEH